LNPMSNLWSGRASKAALNTALTAIAIALAGLAPDARALSLGPIVVQSALGEPLRAEIDVLEINAEEAASLRATVASPEAFRAAGLDYNPAIGNLRVSLQRRANGRSFIRLNSDRPVNDPFVDMILEATWSSGKIVRDYTMLFDPPNLREAPSVAAQVVPPAVPEAASRTAPAPGAVAAAPRLAPAPRMAPAPRPPTVAIAKAKPAAPEKATDGQITVKPGDTASKIAMATKPANVSLDQMLVALLQANPDAFIKNNLNRIKSGAVLNVPTSDQASAMGVKEASQTVIAQSRDFGDFRKKLAGAAPSAQVAAADRKSAGNVQTRVDDNKTGTAAPDKLTLSKGAVAAQTNVDKVAQELAAKEAAARNAAVAKNIAELTKLGAASAPVGSATPAATGQTPSAATAAPPVAGPAVIAAVGPAVASASAAAAVTAPATASAPPKPVVKAPAAPVREPTLIDQLTENPLVPAAGVALVALLAGFGLYRARQRKNAEADDSAFLESRLQPDSFFGGSGGQRVDTQDSQGGGSSMVYTPSQLDAADDVDPVAEADVYLAYGRDVQAEEILKEALKANSGRLAIHHKLLEIYAKRRDTRNFEITAVQAYKLTHGEGADWTRICDQGVSIDPTNPLYMPGGQPFSTAGIPSKPAPLGSSISAHPAGLEASASLSTAPLAAAAASAGLATVAMANNSFNATTKSLDAQPTPAGSVDLDLDLDLDFSLDDHNASVITDLGNTEQTMVLNAADSRTVPLDLNFDMPTVPATVSAAIAPSTRSTPLEFTLPGITGLSNSGEVSRPAPLMPAPDFNLDPGLDFEPSPVETEQFKHQAAVSFGNTVAGPLTSSPSDVTTPVIPQPGLMQFDLSALSLDLDDVKPVNSTAAQPAPITAATPLEDPLATKLSLAEEFDSIGDTDGARALIEEVLLEATGEVKVKAQQALAKLS
jgi:pilus assembly protein FimV